MSKKNTKRALLSSVLALVLCLSMLIGTTFAWFTDSVTSGVNQIIAGNLDVELYHSNKVDKNEKVSVETPLFDDVTLWEPGAVAYENLTVVNEGTLALKYELSVNFMNENATTDGYKLSQVLQVAVTDEITTTDREELVSSIPAEDWQSLASFVLPGDLAVKGESDTYGIVIWWEPSDADNNWNLNNGKKTNNGKDHLHVDLGISLVATQLMAESDSFGPDYDEDATYIEPWDGSAVTPEQDANGVYQINSAAELAGFAELVNSGKPNLNAVLNSDINLGNKPWRPIGSAPAGGDNWGYWYNGTFDGQGYTVYGMNVQASWAALFGMSYSGTIKNVNVDGAYVMGGSYGAGIIGYGYATVQNCSVSNSTILGSYAGGISAYRGDVKYENCTVNNNMITGWYCAGGVVGLSGGEPGSISYNTVTNNTIYLVDYKPTASYRGAGEIAGCDTGTATIVGNTTENNEVVIVPYTETTVVANAADLLELSNGKYEGNIVLIADIDLEGASIKSIASAYGKELNVIGNGFTISNAVLEPGTHNGMNNYGLFYAYTSSTLTVSDLTIENVTVDATVDNQGAAVVLGYMDGNSKVTLNNVDVNNSTVKNPYDEAAVFVSYQTGTLVMNDCDSVGCSVEGETAAKTGAFIGCANDNAALNNCTTDLKIGVCNRILRKLTVDGALVAYDSATLSAAVAAGETSVCLTDGEYELKGNQVDGLTIIGLGDNVKLSNLTNFAGNGDLGAIWQNVNFENVIFTEKVYTMAGGAQSSFKNCTFEQGFRRGYARGVTFTGCTFYANSEGFALHFEKVYTTVTVTDCDFVEGTIAFGDNGDGLVTFNDCTFSGETTRTEYFDAWASCVLNDCVFAEGTEIWLEHWETGESVTLNNTTGATVVQK